MTKGSGPRIEDAIALAWVIVWIIVGGLVTREVHKLSQYSETLEDTARAIDTTSDALESVGSVPFVGGQVDELAAELNQTSSSIRKSATATDGATWTLGWLMGVSIAVIPSFPILAVYLPWRIRRARDQRRLSSALASGDEARLERVLLEKMYGGLPPELAESIRTQGFSRHVRMSR